MNKNKCGSSTSSTLLSNKVTWISLFMNVLTGPLLLNLPAFPESSKKLYNAKKTSLLNFTMDKMTGLKALLPKSSR
jgi:hypothetical protein